MALRTRGVEALRKIARAGSRAKACAPQHTIPFAKAGTRRIGVSSLHPDPEASRAWHHPACVEPAPSTESANVALHGNQKPAARSLTQDNQRRRRLAVIDVSAGTPPVPRRLPGHILRLQSGPAVPKFSFHWTGESSPAFVDLPDEDAAWGQAVATTGEILRDMDRLLPVPGDFEMTVCDTAGTVLLSITVQTRHRPAESGGR